MSDAALVQLSRAQSALAECKTAMEAKQIADMAEAARVYLERTNASVATVNNATEIRLLAERQMGEFLKQMPKNEGGDPVPHQNRVSEPPTLASIGITKKQSHVAQKLAAIPEPEFRERIAVAKCDGGKLSTAKVMEPAPPHTPREIVVPFAPTAIAAGEEAERDSETLWKLKSTWAKTNKRDRAAFIAWATQ